MEPKLILLNGNPGMGKTTLATRYAQTKEMTLNLDVDNIWIMMTGWDTPNSDTNRLKRKYSYAITDMHLAEGHDVIVPNILQTIEQYESFERIARANNAALKEVVLLSNVEDAIERCKTRARTQGHQDGFRPGGLLDKGGREVMLRTMHANMLDTIAQRPNMVRIESVRGDIDGTYNKLLQSIQ